MTYFVFDMDETLAELHSVYFFIASLRIKEIFNTNKINIPHTLEISLNRAYRLFVKKILKQETSTVPLGILRPGILQIMEELYELQKDNKIKNVLIYSNNGHLESLHFIRDLIHEYLKTDDLIRECIHWNHHMRSEERTLQPGAANKTWNVLKNILIHGDCSASADLDKKDVYFFDDLDHRDLQDELGSNYYKVPPYEFKAPFYVISKIYKDALSELDVNYGEFRKYLIKAFGGKLYYKIDDFIEMFKRRTGKTDILPPPSPDEGIDMMMDAIGKIAVTGGKRGRGRHFFLSIKRRNHKRYYGKSRTRKRN